MSFGVRRFAPGSTRGFLWVPRAPRQTRSLGNAVTVFLFGGCVNGLPGLAHDCEDGSRIVPRAGQENGFVRQLTDDEPIV